MEFRHEWKHEINYPDLLALRARLSAVMHVDPHAVNGSYQVRSLYFDNLEDKVLLEKLDGVNQREKFRIRLYNHDPSLILLEKKSKVNGLCRKEQARLSVAEAQAAVGSKAEARATAGSKAEAFPDGEKPLLKELIRNRLTQGLGPRTVVDYTREAFVFGPGNVRVTLDYDIRTGLFCTDFLNPGCITVPAGDAPIILEVKWDEFLPSVIRDVIQLRGRRHQAFSKYAACRIYG